MLGMVRGATVPARWASSMVMGEEMGTVTVVPAELVKLMALMVTAHSSTESEGVSPMLIRTAVEDAGGVVVVPEPEPPLLHPVMSARGERTRTVSAAKILFAGCGIVVLLGRGQMRGAVSMGGGRVQPSIFAAMSATT